MPPRLRASARRGRPECRPAVCSTGTVTLNDQRLISPLPVRLDKRCALYETDSLLGEALSNRGCGFRRPRRGWLSCLLENLEDLLLERSIVPRLLVPIRRGRPECRPARAPQGTTNASITKRTQLQRARPALGRRGESQTVTVLRSPVPRRAPPMRQLPNNSIPTAHSTVGRGTPAVPPVQHQEPKRIARDSLEATKA
jgi:hypothetical protein